MPSIIGINSNRYKRMPDKIVNANVFSYVSGIGKLTLRNQEVYRRDLRQDLTGNNISLNMYNGWTTLYKNYQYLGHDAGLSKCLRDGKTGSKFDMVLSDFEEFTIKELIDHKDLLFYNDASFKTALLLMEES